MFKSEIVSFEQEILWLFCLYLFIFILWQDYCKMVWVNGLLFWCVDIGEVVQDLMVEIFFQVDEIFMGIVVVNILVSKDWEDL